MDRPTPTEVEQAWIGWYPVYAADEKFNLDTSCVPMHNILQMNIKVGSTDTADCALALFLV
jgi:hypothetical protein